MAEGRALLPFRRALVSTLAPLAMKQRSILALLGLLALAAPGVALQSTPTLEFVRRSSLASEPGNSFRVFVRLSAPTTVAVTAPVSFLGSATQGADFAVASSSVTVPAGQDTAYLQFEILDDALFEGTERTRISLGTPTGASLGQQVTHTLRIEDNDPTPALAASLSAPGGITLLEPAGTIVPTVVDLAVAVTLDAPAGLDLPLELAPAGAAASASDSVVEVVGGAVVPAGATGAVVSVRVTILPDDLFEGPEDLELQVSFAPPHATLPCSAGTLWVRDAEQLGERFCLTNANSTGAPASITAWNVSPYKVGETITLEATQLPTDAIGYFLVSPVTRPAYPVASWYLCIGNSLHRVLGNGQVPQSAGPDGRITIEFDRAVDAGPYFVQPGDTLHFQAWHSDPALGTSNATGALSVVMR